MGHSKKKVVGVIISILLLREVAILCNTGNNNYIDGPLLFLVMMFLYGLFLLYLRWLKIAPAEDSKSVNFNALMTPDILSSRHFFEETPVRENRRELMRRVSEVREECHEVTIIDTINNKTIQKEGTFVECTITIHSSLESKQIGDVGEDGGQVEEVEQKEEEREEN